MYRSAAFFKKSFKPVFAVICLILCLACGAVRTYSADEGSSVPDEYDEFIGSLDPSLSDKLPQGAFSDDEGEIADAADELTSPLMWLAILLDALSAGIKNVLPTFGAVLCTVMLSALMGTVSSGLGGGVSRVAECCTRLCTFCAISGIAIGQVESLKVYFERLFSLVASFIPLSAALYAMGGNLSVAVSSTSSVSIILTVCQFFCTYTVMPVFCVCLALTLLSVFDNGGADAGREIGGSVRKWYTTALAFVMMILTGALATQSILAAKSDNAVMRGAKFALNSFVPLSGGTVSSTLGTLAASVELLRTSIGVIGIAILVLLLTPMIIELALLRAVFSIGAFCAKLVGCRGEAGLLCELDSLYGYLEGVAVLCTAVFLIAFGIFASIATPFS